MPLLVKTYSYITSQDENTEEITEELYDESESLDSLYNIVSYLRYAEPSRYPVNSADCLTGMEWATSYDGQDMRTGEYEHRHTFLYHANGKELKPHQLYRVWKIAGIAE